MTAEHTLALLYHPAQESDARRMAEELKLAPIRSHLLDIRTAENWEQANADDYILLFLSDNLLLDQDGMKLAASYLPQWQSAGKLILLLTPGTRTTEKGRTERYPTQIERTKDFMRYINYWQQKYLELRRQKRQASQEELPAIREKIQNLRAISADIGNFFNFLRSLESYKPEEVQQDNYQKLFELLQLQEAWPAFAKHRQSHDSEAPAGPQTAATSPVIDEEPAPTEAPVKEPEAGKAPEEEQENSPQENETPPEQAKQDSPKTTEEEDESETYSVEELLQKARELRQQDEAEKALQLLEKGLAQHSEEAEIRYQFALLLIEHRKEAEAACQQLETAVQHAPERVEIRFLFAELLEYLDEQTKALKQYEIITQQAPKQAEAWSRLAILYATFMPEKKKKAGKAYAKAAKYNPEDSDLQFLYAQHLREKGAKKKKIIQALKEVLRRNPNHAMAHLELARLYLAKIRIDKKEYERAIGILEELLKENRDNRELILTAADVYLKLGNTQRAKELIQEYIRDPRISDSLKNSALRLLALAYVKEGNYDEAYNTLESMVVRDSTPQYFAVRLEMGRLLLMKGDTQGAKDIFQYISEVSKDTARFYSYYYLGLIEESRGNFEGALSYYEDASKMGLRMAQERKETLVKIKSVENETDPIKIYRVAEIMYLNMNKPDITLDMLRKVLRNDPPPQLEKKTLLFMTYIFARDMHMPDSARHYLNLLRKKYPSSIYARIGETYLSGIPWYRAIQE